MEMVDWDSIQIKFETNIFISIKMTFYRRSKNT